MAQSQEKPAQQATQQHSAQPQTEQNPAKPSPNTSPQNQGQGDKKSAYEEQAKPEDTPRRGFLSAAAHAIERYEKVINVFSTLSLALFTALLFVATLILAASTDDLRRYAEEQASDMKSSIEQAKRAADIARDQMTLAYPAKIKVGSIHFWEEGKGKIGLPDTQPVPDLMPGQKIEGVVFAINYGRDKATVIRSDCFAYWWSGENLPMYRPFFSRREGIDDVPIKRWLGTHFAENLEIWGPGGLAGWSFKTVVPPDKITAKKNLFVMGYVNFVDRLGTRRATFFTRRYDPTIGRFVPSNDPDYENEE